MYDCHEFFQSKRPFGLALGLTTLLALGACAPPGAGEPDTGDASSQSTSYVAEPGAASASQVYFRLRVANRANMCLSTGGDANSDYVRQTTCGQSGEHDVWYTEGVPHAANAFLVRNKSTGKCMNIQGGSQGNSAHIIQYDCDTSSKDEWFANEPGRGDYQLIASVYAIGKCLNVQGNSYKKYAPVVSYTCDRDAVNELFEYDVQ